MAGAARRALTPVLKRELLLLAAVAALGRGATISTGVFSFEGVAFVVAAALLIALASRAPDGSAGSAAWACAVVACAATGLALAHLLGAPEEIDLAALLLGGTLIAVLATGRRVAVAGAAVAAVTLLGMAIVVWRWGSVNIDVFDSLQNAASAVLRGGNPYATTFATPVLVAPGQFIDQTVHFQYLPGAALIVAPARLVGDVRIMSIVAFSALIAFAVLLARQSEESDKRPMRVLALCLAFPMTVLMVHFAWVDVYPVAGFAGWVSLRRTHPRWALACLAFALTIKPTILVALVPALVWSRPARREILLAAVAVAVLVLPFALVTGVNAFYHDVIGIQTVLGFRYDGLTLGATWFALTGHVPPVWVGPLVGAALALFALRRPPRDLADMLIAGAFLSTAGFLLAKWAFLNYYFIPVWLLVLALAGRGVAFEKESDIALPASVRAMPRRRLAAAASPGDG